MDRYLWYFQEISLFRRSDQQQEQEDVIGNKNQDEFVL